MNPSIIFIFECPGKSNLEKKKIDSHLEETFFFKYCPGKNVNSICH